MSDEKSRKSFYASNNSWGNSAGSASSMSPEKVEDEGHQQKRANKLVQGMSSRQQIKFLMEKTL